MIPNSTVDVEKIMGGMEGEKIALSFDENSIQHLMSVLTNMYKDTIMAPVREYSTNALDAQTEAGHDGPIHVTPPSRFSPFFKVRDFGRGLSIENMREVYSKYGASTKRESNAYNGTLGIGSKSGLTYTPVFNVTSFNNGMKHVVEVARDELGGAYLNVIASAPSREPSGVEVSIPVKTEDVARFQDCIVRLFRWWKPGTFHIVDSSLSIKYAKDDLVAYADSDKIFLRNVGRNSDPDMIVMGNVAYPSPFSNLFNGTGVVYFADIGEAVFAPSREALMTVDKNKNILEHCRKEITSHLRKQVEAEMAQAKTLLHAYSLYNGTVADLISSVYGRNSLPVEYKGRDMEKFSLSLFRNYHNNFMTFFEGGSRKGWYYDPKSYSQINFKNTWKRLVDVEVIVVDAPEGLRLPSSSTNDVAERGLKELGLDSKSVLITDKDGFSDLLTPAELKQFTIVQWEDVSSASRKALLAARPSRKGISRKAKTPGVVEYDVFKLFNSGGDSSIGYERKPLSGVASIVCLTRDEVRDLDGTYLRNRTKSLKKALDETGFTCVLVAPKELEKFKKKFPKALDRNQYKELYIDFKMKEAIKAFRANMPEGMSSEDFDFYMYSAFVNSHPTTRNNADQQWMRVVIHNLQSQMHDPRFKRLIETVKTFEEASRHIMFRKGSNYHFGPFLFLHSEVDRYMDNFVDEDHRKKVGKVAEEIAQVQRDYPMLVPNVSHALGSKVYAEYANMVYNCKVKNN